MDEFLSIDQRRDFFKKERKNVKGSGIVDPSSLLNPKSQILGQSLEFIEDLIKGRFKYHGNYAGPSYSAGRKFEKNQIITEKDLRVKPTDRLDALTQKHDLRYQLGATLKTVESRKNALRFADELFIREAKDMLNSEEIGVEEYAKTFLAIQGFKIKLKTDIGYEIEQIPEHDLEEAKKVVHDFFGTEDLTDRTYDDKVMEESIGLGSNNVDLLDQGYDEKDPKTVARLPDKDPKTVARLPDEYDEFTQDAIALQLLL